MKKIDIHIHPLSIGVSAIDDYIRTMDKYELEYALVHAVPLYFFGRLVGTKGSLDNRSENNVVYETCQPHSKKPFGSMHIDLREAPEISIEKAEYYSSQGFRCVKMFPNFGFAPNDEVHESVWQAIEEEGLACLAHCGYLGFDKYTGVMRLQTLTVSSFHFEVPARRYPGINFIFAHFGGSSSYLGTVTLCERLDNCYADSTRGRGRWIWEHRLAGLETFPMSKFLYGTDTIGEGYAEDEK